MVKGIQNVKIDGFQRLEDLKRIGTVTQLGDFIEYQNEVFVVGFSDMGLKLNNIIKAI